MSEQLEHNKKTVTDFYDLMFNQCKPAEAVEKYGKIVEHWDVLQTVPETSANGNTMF
jgi:predicted SnoaL-like aldol condensation-catalyzing enzyme